MKKIVVVGPVEVVEKSLKPLWIKSKRFHNKINRFHKFRKKAGSKFPDTTNEH